VVWPGRAVQGKAVVARLGISWRGMVSQDVVWSGGQGLVRLGGARLGPVRSVQARRSRQGVAGQGRDRSGVAVGVRRGAARCDAVRCGKRSLNQGGGSC